MSARNAVLNAALVTVAAGALAMPVRAQVTPVSSDALHERAEALFASPARYAEAAQLLVRAANAREDTDPVMVKELIVAAKLYAYANRPTLARATMKHAAEHALAQGDVTTSAHACLDAAVLALSQRDVADATRLTQRARRLSAAAHLSRTERNGILERVTTRQAVAGPAR